MRGFLCCRFQQPQGFQTWEETPAEAEAAAHRRSIAQSARIAAAKKARVEAQLRTDLKAEREARAAAVGKLNGFPTLNLRDGLVPSLSWQIIVLHVQTQTKARCFCRRTWSEGMKIVQCSAQCLSWTTGVSETSWIDSSLQQSGPDPR
jgi:hypothetical protein